MADCYVIPQVYNADRFDVDLTPYPCLKEIRANCEELEVFKKAHPDAMPDAVK